MDSGPGPSGHPGMTKPNRFETKSFINCRTLPYAGEATVWKRSRKRFSAFAAVQGVR